MSYQTGTALHIDDLLDKLRTFATNNGWTQDKWVVGSGNGYSSELYLHKGSSYVIYKPTLQAGGAYYHGVFFNPGNVPTIFMYGATGHDGGQDYENQPNTSERTEVTWLLPNMTAYHFFTDPAQTYLHVVVEVTANEFRHMSYGLCNKLGAYDGGEYVMGHWWDHNPTTIDVPDDFRHMHGIFAGASSGTYSCRFHCNIDGFRWKRYISTTTGSSIIPCINIDTQGQYLDTLITPAITGRSASPNTFNQVSPLHQIPAGWIIRGTNFWTPIGHFPDVRGLNMKNIAPSASLILGSDEWLIFPTMEKKNPSTRDNLPNSGYLAYAYLKVP